MAEHLAGAILKPRRQGGLGTIRCKLRFLRDSLRRESQHRSPHPRTELAPIGLYPNLQPLPAEIQITEEIKSQLGCDCITLESGFLMAGTQTMCVLVARVDLRRVLLANPLPKKVVKFSERRFAIPQCDKLKLSTARCYREHEDSESGIRDELEARQERDIRTVLVEAGSAAPVSSIPSPTGR